MMMMMRLICGDAEQVLDKLNNENVQVDCVFTSPNTFYLNHREQNEYRHDSTNLGSENNPRNYIDHLIRILNKVKPILKDTGSMWVHMADAYLVDGCMLQIPERFGLAMTVHRDWLLRGKRIWIRTESYGKKQPVNIFPWNWEYIYWFTKKDHGYTWNEDSIYNDTAVVDVPYIDGEGFPPQPVIEALDMTTREGDIVLDPFMGNGAIGFTAKEMGRKFIGIEIVVDRVHDAVIKSALT